MARAADDAKDFVAVLEQELGEIGTVLPGDAGDQRALAHIAHHDFPMNSFEGAVVGSAAPTPTVRPADRHSCSSDRIAARESARGGALCSGPSIVSRRGPAITRGRR